MGRIKNNRSADPPDSTKGWTTWAWVLVGLAVLAFFMPSLENGFVNYDDERYILGNELTGSLSWAAVVRMFTTTFDGHYHPLTLLSHAMDRVVGGNTPTWVHGHSVLLHAISSALLFLLLARWNRSSAAWVGVLVFALHPLVVESVSWASERKNVLSMVWVLVTMHAYDRAAHTADARWGAAAIGAFVLALLAKTQAMVLLPGLWALDRVRATTPWRGVAAWVKGAMLLPATGAVFMTIRAQQEWSGPSVPYEGIERVIVASGAFARYIGLILFPWGQQSAFHPYPLDTGQDMGAGIILWSILAVLLVALLIYGIQRWPAPMAGALFASVTLIPLLKFIDIPFGRYMMAERYAYIPLVGCAMLAAHGWSWLTQRPMAHRWRVVVLVYLAVLAIQTVARQRVWKDSNTLWSDVIDRHPDLGHAYIMRSIARSGSGNLDQAMADLDRAALLQPGSSTPHRNKAKVFELKGDARRAIAAMDRAIALEPDADATLFAYRGVLHFRAGQGDAGVKDLDHALSIRDDAAIRTDRGLAFLIGGRMADAQRELEEALRLGASDGHAEFLLAAVFLAGGDRQKGCRYLVTSRNKGWPEADRLLREQCGRTFS